MPRAPFQLVLLLLLAGSFLGLGACRDQPTPDRLRYEDFVTSGHLTSNLEAKRFREIRCHDATDFGIAVEDGEELSTLVEIGARGRLVVSGCLNRPQIGGEREPGSLRVAVSAPGGERVGARYEVPDHSGWWTQSVDLAALEGEPGRVRLSFELAAERTLNLRDVYLEHHVPAAALQVRAPPRRILLLSVDTLREDALGLFGGRVPTPNLDWLASRSQVWRPHYAAAGWTQPSHASLLTGQPPAVHGAFGEAIHPAVTTLAQRFGNAGFLTAGLAYDCVWLDPKFGFARGFDAYRTVKWRLPQMAREAVSWMSDHREEPFFFFFHTFEVHSDFWRLPYESSTETWRTVTEEFGERTYGCRDGKCASVFLRELGNGTLERRSRDPEILRHLYDRGLEDLDAALGVLFEDLRELGLFDDLTIVLTSDHGELFLEHGHTLHGKPWQEVLRVPLFIKWPGGRFAGEQETALSSALDVAPTLLEAYGIPHDDLPGTPLSKRREDLPAFSESTWQTVVLGRWKLVHDRLAESYQLYDLEADPGEHRDVLAEQPAEATRLKELLEAYTADGERRLTDLRQLLRRSKSGALSPEEEERLRALGYLGG